MNDYLWDKTGSDAEIERFENLLMTFRHTGSAPRSAAKRVAAAEDTRKFSLGWKLGFAFVALISILAATVLISIPKLPDSQSVSVSVEKTTEKPRILGDPDSLIEPETRSAAMRQPRRKMEPTRASLHRRLPKRAEQRTETIVVTSEEAAAYKDLMTALAITSSKLKIVKDKVNGTEE